MPVCFTWDDTHDSHDLVRQMANDRGQRHTFAIQTNRIDTTNYLTTAQIAQMQTDGHEVAAHTVNHSVLSGLSATDAAAQMADSKSALEAIVGAGNVTTFAYPNGMNGRNDTTDRLAWLRFDRVLSTGLLSNGGVGKSSPFVVDTRHAPDHFLIGRVAWQPSTHQQILELIRIASQRPVVVVIYGHDLDGSGAPTTTQAEEGLDLTEALGVPCLTTAEAFAGGRSLGDSGFEDSTLGSWWITNQTAGNVVESVVDTPATGLPGARSLRMYAASGNVQAAQMVPVFPGVGYTWGAQVRVNLAPGGRAYLRVREYDYTGTVLSTQQSADITSTNWTKVSHTITAAAASAAYALAEFVVSGSAGSAEAWFDHAHFSLPVTGNFA